MTPELALIVIGTLIVGLIVLWLVWRASGGSGGGAVRLPGPEQGLDKGSGAAPQSVESLLDGSASWICPTCHSVNLRRATRCYACASKAIAAASTAAAVAGSHGARPAPAAIPVMAAPAARPHDGPAAVPPGTTPVTGDRVADAQPAAKPAAAVTGTVKPAGPAAVMARRARPGETVAQPATAPGPAMAPVAANAAATPLSAPASPAPGAACPFLGFLGDPATRCDFPDPRNLCYAAVGGNGAPRTPARRLVAGLARSRKPETIEEAYQRSHCLTPAHVQCPRNPASGQASAH